MIKVKKGQDPYSVIGQYIRNHVSAIEDMIAVIEIDGKTSNELFMVDMTVDGYFIWKNDWYEGDENVVLIDFFPVSDACNLKDHWIPCSERLPEVKQKVLVQYADENMATKRCNDAGHLAWFYSNAVAWMPAPEPMRMEKQ